MDYGFLLLIYGIGLAMGIAVGAAIAQKFPDDEQAQ